MEANEEAAVAGPETEKAAESKPSSNNGRFSPEGQRHWDGTGPASCPPGIVSPRRPSATPAPAALTSQASRCLPLPGPTSHYRASAPPPPALRSRVQPPATRPPRPPPPRSAPGSSLQLPGLRAPLPRAPLPGPASSYPASAPRPGLSVFGAPPVPRAGHLQSGLHIPGPGSRPPASRPPARPLDLRSGVPSPRLGISSLVSAVGLHTPTRPPDPRPGLHTPGQASRSAGSSAPPRARRRGKTKGPPPGTCPSPPSPRSSCRPQGTPGRAPSWRRCRERAQGRRRGVGKTRGRHSPHSLHAAVNRPLHSAPRQLGFCGPPPPARRAVLRARPAPRWPRPPGPALPPRRHVPPPARPAPPPPPRTPLPQRPRALRPAFPSRPAATSRSGPALRAREDRSLRVPARSPLPRPPAGEHRPLPRGSRALIGPARSGSAPFPRTPPPAAWKPRPHRPGELWPRPRARLEVAIAPRRGVLDVNGGRPQSRGRPEGRREGSQGWTSGRKGSRPTRTEVSQRWRNLIRALKGKNLEKASGAFQGDSIFPSGDILFAVEFVLLQRFWLKFKRIFINLINTSAGKPLPKSPHSSEPMNRTWEAKLKQIEERASRYERKPLSSVYRPRLSKPEEPPSIWKLFYRQTEAFNFVKSCKEDVHVFALECKVGDGQRIYLVTTYTQLWFYYKSRKNLLHCYEVIPENAVCKLYFDLEFNKLANPGADGKKMVALLIEHVCKALQELYRVNCSAEDVFNLDSSTDEKFSCHLIFQLPDVAFKDNIHVGNFVRKILQPAFRFIASEDDDRIPETTNHGFSHFSETPIKQGISFSKTSSEKDVGESWTLNSKKLERLGPAKQGSPDLSFLVVKNNKGERHLFVDLGVYTRNRNFRLYKSSKIGKHVALEVAEDNRFSPTQSMNISEEYQYFLSSLVSNVRFSDTLRILTCDTFQNEQKRVEDFNGTSTSVERIEGFQCSPYPEIDQFVLSVVNKNGIKGGIRHWNYFFLEELLVYDICKYRWCENIGRAHKSNNIMILVDLKNEVWYQKCHDPVCKAGNFKSDCFPLPAEVCLQFLLKDEEGFTTDATTNRETKSPHKPSSCTLSKATLSGADWDSGIDDTSFLEATEDAELAEAAENSLLSYNRRVDEIPDELIIEVLQE